MGILDDIKKALSGFGASNNSFVGIDIGSSSIKLVQLKKESGRIHLETYGEVSLSPYDDENIISGEVTHLDFKKIAEAVTNLTKEANVSSKSAAYGLSSSSSLVFTLKLPKVSDSELNGIVQTEARKYIPIPLTEISLDWWIIPQKESYSGESKKELYVDVLVAAVRNEVLDHYGRVHRELSQFKDSSYEIETFSAIRGAFKHELSPVLIFDYGASGSRISIVEHGVVKKFHAVNRGSYALTQALSRSLEIGLNEAEKLKKKYGLGNHPEFSSYSQIMNSGVSFIFTELSNVIYEFEKDYKKPIGKIILLGGGSRLIGLKGLIQTQTSLETHFADPFSKVISPDFLDEALEKIGPSFTVALGLALQNFK